MYAHLFKKTTSGPDKILSLRPNAISGAKKAVTTKYEIVNGEYLNIKSGIYPKTKRPLDISKIEDVEYHGNKLPGGNLIFRSRTTKGDDAYVWENLLNAEKVRDFINLVRKDNSHFFEAFNGKSAQTTSHENVKAKIPHGTIFSDRVFAMSGFSPLLEDMLDTLEGIVVPEYQWIERGQVMFSLPVRTSSLGNGHQISIISPVSGFVLDGRVNFNHQAWGSIIISEDEPEPLSNETVFGELCDTISNHKGSFYHRYQHRELGRFSGEELQEISMLRTAKYEITKVTDKYVKYLNEISSDYQNLKDGMAKINVNARGNVRFSGGRKLEDYRKLANEHRSDLPEAKNHNLSPESEFYELVDSAHSSYMTMRIATLELMDKSYSESELNYHKQLIQDNIDILDSIVDRFWAGELEQKPSAYALNNHAENSHVDEEEIIDPQVVVEREEEISPDWRENRATNIPQVETRYTSEVEVLLKKWSLNDSFTLDELDLKYLEKSEKTINDRQLKLLKSQYAILEPFAIAA